MKFTKNLAAAILSGILVLATVVPSIIVASPFTLDTSVRVFPESEVLVFPNTRVGETTTLSFVVENQDSIAKTIDVVTTPSAPFNYRGTARLNIPSAQEVTIPVTFSPTETGYFETFFTIKAQTGETKSLYVQGVGTTSTSNNGLKASHSQLQFADTALGFITEATISVTNNNTYPVTLTLNERPELPFRLLSGEVQTILPGGVGEAVVSYTPTHVGRDRSEIQWTTNDPDRRTVTVELNGKAFESAEASYTEIAFNPSTTVIDFGTVTTDTENLKNVVISNTGNSDLHVKIANEANAPFEADIQERANEATISKDKNRNLRFAFKPLVPGNFTTQVTITSNSFNQPSKTFILKGTAVEGINQRFDFNVNAIADDERITNNEGTNINVDVNLPATVSVEIKKDGKLVKEVRSVFDGVVHPNRSVKAFWDGTNELGLNALDGTYTYKVTAYSTVDNQTATSIGTIEVDKTYKKLVLEPIHDFEISRNTVNPDRGEMVYFNFYTPWQSKISYRIVNIATGAVVKTASKEIKSGGHNYEIGWDGKSNSGSKVMAGKYEFEFTVKPTSCHPHLGCMAPETFKGIINVSRTSSHLDEPIKTYVKSFVNNNFYPYYSTNETLLTKLSANPYDVTAYNQGVEISFQNQYSGQVSIWILAPNGEVVERLVSNQNVSSGYHKNYTYWSAVQSGRAISDGRYMVKIQFENEFGEDTDIIYVDINRSGAFISTGSPFLPSHIVNYPGQAIVPVHTNGGTCNGYVDVDAYGSICDAVEFVVDTGIFQGSTVDGVKFMRTNDYLTRAEATAIILRVMKIDPSQYSPILDGNLGFSDLNTNAWYMPYIKTIIKTATQQQAQYGNWVRNIMQGYPDGTIRPNQVMSKAEFYKVFLEAAVNSNNVYADFSLDYHVTDAPFSDTPVDEATEWYLPYAKWAATYLNDTPFAKEYFDNSSLDSGVRRFKGPKGITRGEVMELIYTTDQLGVIRY